MEDCRITNPFECYTLPLQEWTTDGLRWLVDNYRPFFQAMKTPIEQILQSFNALFAAASPLMILIIVGLLAWQIGGRKVAISSLLALIFCGLIGVWQQTMLTVAIVLTSLVLALVIGIPLGVWAAKSDRAYKIMRPILDGMQTIPAFVYLVPVVMLFGIGNVSGVIVTIIFAISPVIRLTNLGIRQVPTDVLEAMRAFGCNEWQLLRKAQIPLALPSIMTGVNQTLMMSLSMVVIASMIAVGGLGAMVLQGIGRLDVGLATVGGLGIVMLAIVLDRLTQSFHRSKARPGDFLNRGPIGLIRKVLRIFSENPTLKPSTLKR